MTDNDLMHGENYAGQPIVGWLASEKMDGVRLAWDGAKLWTRSGREVAAPAWFRAGLPAGLALDGELWAGRGQFQLSRNAVNHGNWDPSLRFWAFDAPGLPGTWLQRYYRLEPLEDAIPRHQRIVRIVRIWTVETNWQETLRLLITQGAEGIVARDPGLVGYWPGRTCSILKLKTGALSHGVAGA